MEIVCAIAGVVVGIIATTLIFLTHKAGTVYLYDNGMYLAFDNDRQFNKIKKSRFILVRCRETSFAEISNTFSETKED